MNIGQRIDNTLVYKNQREEWTREPYPQQNTLKHKNEDKSEVCYFQKRKISRETNSVSQISKLLFQGHTIPIVQTKLQLVVLSQF
jgi:hypothetical protein